MEGLTLSFISVTFLLLALTSPGTWGVAFRGEVHRISLSAVFTAFTEGFRHFTHSTGYCCHMESCSVEMKQQQPANVEPLPQAPQP